MRSTPSARRRAWPRASTLASAVVLGTVIGAPPATIAAPGNLHIAADAAVTRRGATDRTGNKLTLGLGTLAQEYDAYRQAVTRGDAVAGSFTTTRTLTRVSGERVAVDAIAGTDGGALADALTALGAEVKAVRGLMVSAQVPLSILDAMRFLPQLRFARPVLAMTRTGSVVSQGDEAQRSDFARSGYEVDGSGLYVGVLSDSFDCLTTGATYADDVNTGDLPDDVEVLDDLGSGCSDEGRAMAQIVHDVAPGAALGFHSAFNGEADFAQGILDLRNAGADIIVDDVGYYAEPFFQDGVVAQAVDAVVADGAVYFSSAGNSARQSYEAPFRAGGGYTINGDPVTAHDFDPGTPVDDFQQISCEAGDRILISLQWSNPYPSLGGPNPPAADLDIYLLDGAATTILAGSAAIQRPNGDDPVEIFGYNCTSAETLNLLIALYDGTAPDRIKYIDFGTRATTADEYITDSPTSTGHPNAAGAIATGAAAWFYTPAFGTNPPLLESFSSAGGVPILFAADGSEIPGGELRDKPDVTGPDGGNTTFFYSDSFADTDTYPNFFGTSASAPHVAAVAALMQQAAGGALSNEDIRTTLKNTAIDIAARHAGETLAIGFDNDSGAGLIDAEAAVGAVAVADLSVALSDDADPVVSGSQVIYSADVGNNGPTPARDAELTLSLAAGAGYGIAPGGCTAAGQQLTCDLGDIAAGDDLQLDIPVDVAADTTGSISVTAVVSTTSNDSDGANDSTSETTDVTLFGDQDGDDCITRADVTALLGLIRGGSTDPALDINGNGSVNLGDVRALVQLYSNGGASCIP